jgi:hypothetical protein
MLTLTGKLRKAHVIPASTNRKTGEVYPARAVVQVEVEDRRGLVQLVTLTVPDHRPYERLDGQEVSLPVQAYAQGGGTLQFVLADKS